MFKVKMYRIKHKPTGLYYKPGTPNLSTKGKVYATGLSVMSYDSQPNICCHVRKDSKIAQQLAGLGIPLRESYKGRGIVYVFLPKTEFEIENLH